MITHKHNRKLAYSPKYMILLLLMQKLEVLDFLNSSKINPVIDVRSPSEFDQGHIPGAINIPLFSDEERKIIGTLYKKRGKQVAIVEGLDIIGPKMSTMVRLASKLKAKDQLLVYCWRGGMRSESFTWLMNTAELPAKRLDGGYKSYRNYALKYLTNKANLVLLTGATGSGKTEILAQLKNLGEQVIDLENLASHKGSVFGGFGQLDQPTTEQFQNNLFEEFHSLDLSKRIWIEDESVAIGGVQIPKEFWDQMSNSPFIKIEINKTVRIKRLVHEYGLYPASEIENKILKISKRLGGLDTKIAIEQLYKGNLSKTAELLLRYYDKAYQNCVDRKESTKGRLISPPTYDINKIAEQLINEAAMVEERICL